MGTTPETVAGALESLAGVLAAKVQLCDQGRIQSVEILAEGPKSAPQLVRDVQSLLYTVFRQRVAVEAVQVAKVSDSRELGLIPVRVRIESIAMRAGHGDACCVEVILADEANSYTGSAAATTLPFRWRLGALAALDALRQMIGGRDALWLEDARRLEVAGQAAIFVAVGYGWRDRRGLLLGTSLARDGELEAAVRATLDAVNRKYLVT